jgi:hypothetical protein
MASVLNGFKAAEFGIPLLAVAVVALLGGVLLGSGSSAGDLMGLTSRDGWRNLGDLRSTIRPMEDYEQSVRRLPENLDGVGREEVESQDPADIRAWRNKKLSICIIVASVLAGAGSLRIDPF